MTGDFNGIIGHQAQIEYLRKIIAGENVAHAYLFSGAERLGKRTIAREFASIMLGIEENALDTHPNFYFVDYPLDEKTGEPKPHIDIDSIRDARERMQLSTFDGGRKILLIDHADSMTLGAQNALLKTLEEPSGDALIILVACMPKILLPTIVSRSVHIRFAPVASKIILQSLGDKALALKELVESFAYGRPGIALEFLNDERREEIELQRKDAKAFFRAPLAKRFGIIASLTKKKERNAVQEALKTWRMQLHEDLAESLGTPSALRVAIALNALEEADESIRRNGNVPLALEYFAIHL
ncbi:MAG: hypothetical protein WCT24_01825 [Patescibacteria group bacterium]|jgi:DNA polymerase-3 subunit delta'